jgi:predicted GNAT family acetyltransferase
MSIIIKQDTQHSCFTVLVDGHRCVINYVLKDRVMTITHTGVPDAVGGRGIAAAMTQFALDTARQAGLQVVPVCSYTIAYIRRHPEYTDLIQ